MTLNGGIANLACTDLVVGGTLQVVNGTVDTIRNVSIQPGVIDGGSGLLTLGGDWTDNGNFIAGTSAVRFRDLCGAAGASIGGNTSFRTASFVSTSAKNYTFAGGTTQTITGLLEISGTGPQPIQFRSSTPGQVAFINLLGGGTQAIQHVGVTDVWATGQWLAPSLTNEGGGGNASRWFGNGVPSTITPIPALGTTAQVLLALMLGLIGFCTLRRSSRYSPQPTQRR